MLELILRVDPTQFGHRSRLLPDQISFNNVSRTRGKLLVVGNTSAWEPRRLQRALSKRFENVRRMRTGSRENGVYFVVHGNQALDQLGTEVERRGPMGTEIQSGMVSDRKLYFRVFSEDKEWARNAEEAGIHLAHARVYAPRWTEVDFLRHGLSEPELEAAQLAVEHGYYTTPRGCTMSDLAESLGISKSAVYHRLSGFERKLADRATDLPGDPRRSERQASSPMGRGGFNGRNH